MTTTKGPTPEAIASATALAFVEKLRDGWGEAEKGYALAVALDAWGAALLRRQEDAKAPDEPETAVHFSETTERNCTVRLPYTDPLMAFREVKRWRDMQARTYEDGSALLDRFQAQEAALEAEKAAHEATRKEAHESLQFFADGVCEANRELRREIEALRKPLEGELAEDVERLRLALAAALIRQLSEEERTIVDIVLNDYGVTEARQIELHSAIEAARALRAKKAGE